LLAAAAAGHAASGGSIVIEYVLLFVVFAAVIYFTSIAPQRKKDREWKERMSHLKRGVRVLTRGGLYGLVTDVADDVITVRVADKVEVKVNRAYIAEVLRADVRERERADEGSATPSEGSTDGQGERNPPRGARGNRR